MNRTASLDTEKAIRRAMTLLQDGLIAPAGGQLIKVLRKEPNSILALQLMGMVTCEQGKHSLAVQYFKRALQLDPSLPSVHMNLANVYERCGQLEDAAAVLKDAVERGVRVPLPQVLLTIAAWQQELCDWGDYDSRLATLAQQLKSSERKVEGAGRYSMLVWDEPSVHRHCALLEVGAPLPNQLKRTSILQPAGRRLRVAYVSADFRRHPTSRLIPGVLEAHNRERYEISAISLMASDGSDERRRIEAAVDTFIDAHNRTTEEIVALMQKREIDIVVDLMGHTKHSRPDIYLRRSAPVQINYLGYPGTSGLKWFDYLIADPFVVTSELRNSVSEQLVILPHCYQCNDDKRDVPGRTTSRAECGLPEEGFVFASFNELRKLTPAVFDVWMRILQRANGSVLWLLSSAQTAIRNLRAEAARRGVDPARLIFADRVSPDAHLARIGNIDLALDTFPYTSHTTGSDVLWSGRPQLTMAGRGFPSRVCGSLLTTIGTPELVTTTWEDYEALAVRLSHDDGFLRELAERIVRGRAVSPLFDTLQFTRNLERAFEAMAALSAAGKSPAEIDLTTFEVTQ